MKITITILAVLALVGVACGTSDEQAVEDQVRTLLNAMADGDGDAGCATLTQEGQESFEVDLTLDQENDPASCPDGFVDFAGKLSGAGVDLDSAEIDRVEIDGDEATVGLEESVQTFDLEKVDGDWLIGPIE
jgi:hypothetical protein